MKRALAISAALSSAIGAGCLPGVFLEEAPGGANTVDSFCPASNRTATGQVVIASIADLQRMEGCVAVEGDLLVEASGDSLAALFSLERVTGLLLLRAEGVEDVELPALREVGILQVQGVPESVTRQISIPQLTTANLIDLTFPPSSLEAVSLPSLRGFDAPVEVPSVCALGQAGCSNGLFLRVLPSLTTINLDALTIGTVALLFDTGTEPSALETLSLPALEIGTVIAAPLAILDRQGQPDVDDPLPGPLLDVRAGSVSRRVDLSGVREVGAVIGGPATITAPALVQGDISLVSLNGLRRLEMPSLERSPFFMAVNLPTLERLEVVQPESQPNAEPSLIVAGCSTLTSLTITPHGNVTQQAVSVHLEALPLLTSLSTPVVGSFARLQAIDVGLTSLALVQAPSLDNVWQVNLELVDLPALNRVDLTGKALTLAGHLENLPSFEAFSVASTQPQLDLIDDLFVAACPALEACRLRAMIVDSCRRGTPEIDVAFHCAGVDVVGDSCAAFGTCVDGGGFDPPDGFPVTARAEHKGEDSNVCVAGAFSQLIEISIKVTGADFGEPASIGNADVQLSIDGGASTFCSNSPSIIQSGGLALVTCPYCIAGTEIPDDFDVAVQVTDAVGAVSEAVCAEPT